jgi:membrane-bound lytic murein transglycosylase D
LGGSRTITVSGKYSSAVIAKYVLLDSVTFSRYNPDFDKIMAGNNNSYDLKLPGEKMDLFVSNKYDILTESVKQLASGLNAADPSPSGRGIAVKM